MKLLKKLTSTSLLLPLPLLLSYSPLTISYYQIQFHSNSLITQPLQKDDSQWINSLKESASANVVKLFFTRHAADVYQASFLAALYINNQSNNESKPMRKEIGFFVPKNIISETNPPRYNWDILKKQPNVYFGSNYGTVPNHNDFTNILNYYQKTKNFSNVKFDVFIPEISIEDIWKASNSDWFNFLPYVNSIILISDGAAQTWRFATNYKKFIENKQIDINAKSKDLQTLWNQITNPKLAQLQRKQLYDQNSFYLFLHTQHLKIFHIEKYSNSPYYASKFMKFKMYDNYRFNLNYFDLASKLYPNDVISQNNYIQAYEQIMLPERTQTNQLVLKDFVAEGFEHYDPRKKTWFF